MIKTKLVNKLISLTLVASLLFGSLFSVYATSGKEQTGKAPQNSIGVEGTDGDLTEFDMLMEDMYSSIPEGQEKSHIPIIMSLCSRKIILQ